MSSSQGRTLESDLLWPVWSGAPSMFGATGDRRALSELRVSKSQQRSRRLGIDAWLRSIPEACAEAESEQPVAVAPLLLRHARKLFEQVYPLLGDSSTLLVLADPKARVREIFAAPELVGRCSERGLRSGGSLSEENCGTNAIGLVAKHWELSVVSGAQHHCKMFHDWHCVAAPILDAGGKVHGIVNVARSVSQHLRDEPALVRLLAGTLSSSLDPSLASGDARTLGISPMQGTIVAALRCGLTCKQIASQLNVSARTVESHLERLRRRFSASTTVQLMVILAEGPRVGGAETPSSAPLAPKPGEPEGKESRPA
jgi:DNA-binding CsgD family transcriptional regulator